MNIKFITGWDGDNDTGKITEVDSLDLALCGQGRPEGNAAGLVPIQLASGVVVTPVVTVTSSTSTTKRNSRSAVIKVSIPYTALTKDEDGNLVTDPTRSGADLSIHMVLALPASAVKDIKGSSGDASKLAADAQVALVHYLLMALIGQQLGSVPTYTSSGSTDGAISSRVTQRPAIGGDVGIDATDSSAVAPVPTANVGGYAGAGFNLSSVRVQKDLNSILGRIANGLPALSCADVPAYAGTRTLD